MGTAVVFFSRTTVMFMWTYRNVPGNYLNVRGVYRNVPWNYRNVPGFCRFVPGNSPGLGGRTPRLFCILHVKSRADVQGRRRDDFQAENGVFAVSGVRSAPLPKMARPFYPLVMKIQQHQADWHRKGTANAGIPRSARFLC